MKLYKLGLMFMFVTLIAFTPAQREGAQTAVILDTLYTGQPKKDTIPQWTIQDVKLGMTYNEIKAGPCPDIESEAAVLLSPGFPVYYCPSLKLRIVGSRLTGKIVGIFLWDEIKRGTGRDSVDVKKD